MESSSQRPLAVVTGASRGIGRELSRQFATHGYDLVVAADNDIDDVAQFELAPLGGSVEPVQVDLATPEGVEQLAERISASGRPVAAAALNVGAATGGAFSDTRLEDDLRTIDLNVRSTVHLAKLVLGDMVRHNSGRLLFTSSIVAGMPGPFQAIYNASKSFVQSFALALRNELEDTDVTVTVLMPGPTETEFFERADMLNTVVGTMDKEDPADVARAGFEALMRGDERVVAASLMTKLQGRGTRLLPDSAKAALNRRVSEPGSAKK